jgi:hypothetical protein
VPASARSILNQLEQLSATFDPNEYTAKDAEILTKVFARIERFGSNLRLVCARRVEKANVHQSKGHKDAGSWLAGITGDSVGRAKSELETARAIEAHPEIAQAVAQGQISRSQAAQISSAADVHPELAGDLVESARSLRYDELKKHCNDVRSSTGSSEEASERYEKMRKRRYCKMWTDDEGMGQLRAQMTPDALAALQAALAPHQKQIFQAARREDRFESQAAYDLDALIAMALASTDGSVSGSGSCSCGVSGNTAPGDSDSVAGNDTSGADGSKPKTTKRPGRNKALIRIRVDLQALLRGYTEPGETCQIPGIDGPLPVSLVRELLGESILELVITQGTDVRTVCTDSRYIAKALAIALEERDPVCQVPDCHVSQGLERDHWRVDFVKGGPTELDNLVRLCAYHHHQKHHAGWRIDGGPGQWRWIAPDDKSFPDAATESAKPAGTEPPRAPGKNARPNASNKRAARRKAKDPPGQGEML